VPSRRRTGRALAEQLSLGLRELLLGEHARCVQFAELLSFASVSSVRPPLRAPARLEVPRERALAALLSASAADGVHRCGRGARDDGGARRGSRRLGRPILLRMVLPCYAVIVSSASTASSSGCRAVRAAARVHDGFAQFRRPEMFDEMSAADESLPMPLPISSRSSLVKRPRRSCRSGRTRARLLCRSVRIRWR